MERLVLWDIDRTLVHYAGAGVHSFSEAMLTVTGQTMVHVPEWGGRTDRYLITTVLDTHGIAWTDTLVEQFFTEFAAAVDRHTEVYRERGKALPGAATALAALAAVPGVVQTVVTGNIAPVARLKLTLLDLAAFIDFDIGGYGSESAVRADLVTSARERAALKYGVKLPDQHVIVIGDTVHDIEAARATGAFAVGVATGVRTTAEDLHDAGADLVLESLSDVDRLLAQLISRS